MPRWHDFASAAPELAAFGADRLHGRVAYLATVRVDGLPRLHPVTPIVGEGRLFLFMEPTSPKGRDLERGSAYALHCAVEDNAGGEGEFWLRGVATRITDPFVRALAMRSSSYKPRDRYVLFELDVTEAMSTRYDDRGQPVRQRWIAP